jgi:hypothetical protein
MRTPTPDRRLLVLLALAACSSGDNQGPGNPVVTSYGGSLGWVCLSGQNCQDVFDFTIDAGSVLTIRVSNVSAGSVAQMALYAPGVAPGGTNLLTGTTRELRCTTGADCNLFTAGEHVDSYTAAVAGTYRLAVTRNWSNSCSGSGTYRLDVTSTKPFTVLGQTVNDQLSLATGFECH